ncbi:tyrosine-type recombinase/integrase [Nitrospira sp. CMX1]
MTIRDLINAHRQSERSPRQEDERHAAWWSDRIGGFLVEELSSDLIKRQLLASAKCGRSVWTSNHYFRFLRRVCRWGQLMAYLRVDPCKTIPLPKDKPPTLRVLTEEEEVKLCRELGQPYALWVKFAILTGLKQSEQFSLLWRAVDLPKATLHLPHPQTRAVVALSLPPDAVEILRQLHHLHPPSLWVFPDLHNPHRPANVHAFYVGRWESAVRRAGIPRISWKDLRHTCGVRLAKAGVPVREVAAFLRQREVRQVYYYRAHQPGEAYIKKERAKSATLVFDELPVEKLHELIGRDATTAPLTFGELCHLYASHHLKARPARRDFESIYRQHWLAWADRLPATITRKEIRLWYFTMEQAPSRANKGAACLRAVFNWGVDMELLTCANPALRLKRYPQPPRERFMDAQEVQRFMDGLSQLPAKPQAFLLLLLLTGCRMGEALRMRWADVDSTSRLWRKGKTKNGSSHVIPLPHQVMEALSCLPRQAEWVFAGTNGKHWSSASISKIWLHKRQRWNLGDVRIHDLRRTAASYLAISGENLPTIQNVLNHRSLTPTAIYARLNTKAVDRALQAQADRFCSLMAPGEGDRIPERELVLLE